jgi:phage FluMu protein Com
MHNPELEIEEDAEAKCPRCGLVDVFTFGGVEGDKTLHSECPRCNGPVEYPRDLLNQPPEPDYEYLSGQGPWFD